MCNVLYTLVVIIYHVVFQVIGILSARPSMVDL